MWNHRWPRLQLQCVLACCPSNWQCSQLTSPQHISITAIINRIEIWELSRLIHQSDVVLYRPLLGYLGRVSGCRVLLQKEFSSTEQVVKCGHHKTLQDVLIHSGGHREAKETQLRNTNCAHGGPYQH